MKIVIADDEILVRKGISMTLPWQELGFDEVFEASDGQKALDIIMEHPIDLLITDIKMPRMDGLELLEKVSVLSPHTVNIVLSCVNDMECVREAMKFNKAVDYIPKLTMNTDELKSVIRRASTYVRNDQKKEEDLQNKIPLFFEANLESHLRHTLEYGKKEELLEILDKIYEASLNVEDFWKESTEWEEVVSVFASVGKRYGIYEKEYLSERIREIQRQACSRVELEKGISKLALETKEKIEEEKRKSYDADVWAAVKYITQNYEKNIKLGDVAAYVGMSESYFSRHFKKTMGIGFSEYLNKMRVEKAKELLKRKRLTMQEIAEQVGYSNSAYFTHMFKSLTGISPKAYQKENAVNIK